MTTYSVSLPCIGTDHAWRDAAKRLIGAGIQPDQIIWHCGASGHSGQADMSQIPAASRRIKAPKDFITLANTVVWHKDPRRFALLYSLLWRLRYESGLIADTDDAALARLRRMEAAVMRARSRMRADLRFHSLRTGGPRHSFGAWYVPVHAVIEATAPAFARQFDTLDWFIASPTVTARYREGILTFTSGQTPPALRPDAPAEDWTSYFQHIHKKHHL